MRRILRLAARTPDDAGATSIEYAMLAALIAAGLVALMATLGGSVADGFAGFNVEFERVR